MDDYKQYPNGCVALDAGDLVDVTNFTVATVAANKHIHTLRKPGAGKFHAPNETTVTFDAVISEDGAERDWIEMLQKRRFKKLRYKVPGETGTIIGSTDERSLTCTTEDAVKYSVKYSGRLQR